MIFSYYSVSISNNIVVQQNATCASVYACMEKLSQYSQSIVHPTNSNHISMILSILTGKWRFSCFKPHHCTICIWRLGQYFSVNKYLQFNVFMPAVTNCAWLIIKRRFSVNGERVIVFYILYFVICKLAMA